MIDSLSGGGAERVATILASELSSRYHVTLLSVKESAKYPIHPEVDLLLLPRNKNLYGLDYANVSRRLAFGIKVLKKRVDAYATISFLYDFNALNVLSKANDKVVCCERNNPLKYETDRGLFNQIQSIYERADHIVFQTELVRNLFSETIKAKCSILPNPIDAVGERKSVTKKRIVNVGRVTAQKNQSLLIRAFKRFRARHPDYTLSIYGTIYHHTGNKLRNLVETLELQDAVFFEGFSEHVHRDIADAEFFVLSSDYEGLSNALLEAMTMGFPCVSTDCEGSTDVIESGVNGLLVPRGDEDALLDAMLTLAEQEDFREQLGRQAKKTAERFKRERVAQEWAETIEKI